MTRREWSKAILLLVFAIVCHGEARATTVLPRLTKCPVCGKSFIMMVIGSYNTFGEQARDLSSSPFARFTRIQTCPYCLYSALNSALNPDSNELTKVERDRLKRLLAHLASIPLPEEAKALSADALPRPHAYLDSLIARQCDAAREPDPRREFNMSLHFFYRTAHGECKNLHAFYRGRAIKSLRKELDSGRFSEREQATFTYLLGEVLRQDGQYDAAIREFARASELAKPLSPTKPEPDQESFQWIIDWSREQSCRARLAKEPAEKLRPLAMAKDSPKDARASLERQIALETLVGRDDRDSWRVLADFADAAPSEFVKLIERRKPSQEQLRLEPRVWDRLQREFAAGAEDAPPSRTLDVEKLRDVPTRIGEILAGGEYFFSGNPHNEAVLRKILPELNRQMFVDVKASPTRTVDDVAKLMAAADPWSAESERLIELNPSLKKPTDKIGTKPLRAVRVPPLWTERRLMANLHRVIRSGDPQAVEFFFRWCGTVGPVGLERFGCYISDCFEALAAKPDLWSVPRELETSNVAEQRFLACCLRYLHGDAKETSELLSHLAGKSERKASLALDCFTVRRDPAAKEPILKHWEADKRYEWYVQSRAHAYLAELATPEDLPRIEAVAARESADRHEVEQEILLQVRLRDLHQKWTRTKPTTTPP